MFWESCFKMLVALSWNFFWTFKWLSSVITGRGLAEIRPMKNSQRTCWGFWADFDNYFALDCARVSLKGSKVADCRQVSSLKRCVNQPLVFLQLQSPKIFLQSPRLHWDQLVMSHCSTKSQNQTYTIF